MTAWRGPRAVRAEWAGLAAGHGHPDPFDPGMVADLPEPARRWLLHALAPGTPLVPATGLTMHGTIRLGAWRRFTARQVLRPPQGYIWAATAHVFGLPVTGYDRFSSGSAAMRWRLLGVIPVVSADGADVARSAAGRLAAEVVLAPTTFRSVAWTPGEGPDVVVGATQVGGDEQRVEVRVGPAGNVLGVGIQRWGTPPGSPYGRYPFGVSVEAERTFAGVTVPSQFRAGWWWGTERQDEGEFLRAEITEAGATVGASAAAHPVLTAMLRSPLGRLSGGMCVLRFAGRVSGREVALPVQCAREGDRLVVAVGGAATKRWWRNFRGGHAVRVRVGGVDHTGRGQVVDAQDPERGWADGVHRGRLARADPYVVIDLGAPAAAR